MNGEVNLFNDTLNNPLDFHRNQDGTAFKSIWLSAKQVLWVQEQSRWKYRCNGCGNLVTPRPGMTGLMICHYYDYDLKDLNKKYAEGVRPYFAKDKREKTYVSLTNNEQCTHPQYIQDPRTFVYDNGGQRVTFVPSDEEIDKLIS